MAVRGTEVGTCIQKSALLVLQDDLEVVLEKEAKASRVSPADREKTLKLHQEAQAFADQLRKQ